MGTGYTRNDTDNNIADGNVINAADFDGEFDAIVTALSTSGHTHDGTAAEGGPVSVIGPAQDITVSATIVSPKSNNTLDLGTDALEFKDIYIDGVAYIDGLGRDLLVAGTNKVQFTNTGTYIHSTTANQIDLVATGAIKLTSDAIEFGEAGNADIVLTFNATSNDGVITWMEDEDYFQFSDDILMTTTEKLYFTNTDNYIYSDTAGNLDLVAATEIHLAATTINIDGALDFSGQVTFADGSASAPSISNTGDVNAGLFFSAADTMAFSAGGTAQFTMADGVIAPVADSDVDLGTSSLFFKDAFIDTIVIKDTGTIGSASDTDAMSISAGGVVNFTARPTFAASLTIQDGGSIGSTTDLNAITISSGGVVAVTATTESTSATSGALTVAGGVGIAKDLSVGDDLRLISDDAVLSFGEHSDVTITHDPDDGLFFKSVATGPSNPFLLTIQTGETSIGNNDVLGKIQFQAPEGGGGGAAQTIAAAIQARASAAFASDANQTALDFMTGAGEAASTRMIVDHDLITAAEPINITDSTASTSSTTGSLIVGGGVGIAADLFVGDDFDVTGNAVIDGTTLATGILTATAKTVFNGGFGLPDNQKATFGGTGTGDLQIYHDGSNSYIEDAGTGSLTIKSNTLVIADTDGDTMLVGLENGEARLYHNGSEKLNTNSTGVTVTGEMAATTMDLSSNAVIDGTALVTGVLTTTAATVFNGGFASNAASTITDDLSITGATPTFQMADTSVSNNVMDFVYDETFLIDIDPNNARGSTAFQIDQDGTQAFKIDSSRNAVFAGTVTANAGVVVDNFTLDGTTLALSSGDMTLDVAGDIILDAAGGDIRFTGGGTQFAKISNTTGNMIVESFTSNADILLQGSDNGSNITALTLDMSDEGAAKFNNKIVSGLGSGYATDANITLGAAVPAIFFHDTDSGTNNGAISLNNGVLNFLGQATGGNVSDQVSLATLDYNLDIKNGNLIVAADHGVYFGAATGHTKSVSSNLLSDYEEGVWTAVLKDSPGGTTVATTSSTAYYTKVGRVCHITLSVTRNDTQSLTGALQIAGLPFTSEATSPITTGTFWMDNSSSDFIGINYQPGGATTINLKDTAGVNDYVATNEWENGRAIYLSGVYTTT